ncbi:MAG: hypothetical protein KGL69_12320, partial [Alphaproteobacteria bacterium]|nr:hypothetical protein [Alphaproteobacteria bacterium]
VSEQGARDPSQLSLGELLDAAVGQVFESRPLSGEAAQVRRDVQARLVIKLARLTQDATVSPAVSAAARARLDRLGADLSHRSGGDPAEMAQASWLSDLILDKAPGALARLVAADRTYEPPPGMPIGDGDETCWFCEGTASFGEAPGPAS